jgi:hypothetical protein
MAGSGAKLVPALREETVERAADFAALTDGLVRVADFLLTADCARLSVADRCAVVRVGLPCTPFLFFIDYSSVI